MYCSNGAGVGVGNGVGETGVAVGRTSVGGGKATGVASMEHEISNSIVKSKQRLIMTIL